MFSTAAFAQRRISAIPPTLQRSPDCHGARREGDGLALTRALNKHLPRRSLAHGFFRNRR